MLQRLTTITRALALVVGAVFGPLLPQSSLQVVVLAVVGVAVLVPLVGRLAGSRILASMPHGPSRIARAVGVLDDVDMPAAPGTPGTALARAPSRGSRAFA